MLVFVHGHCHIESLRRKPSCGEIKQGENCVQSCYSATSHSNLPSCVFIPSPELVKISQVGSLLCTVTLQWHGDNHWLSTGKR